MAKGTPRLTEFERDALARIVNERTAGSDRDLADALGCTERQARQIMAAASRAITKLR